MLWFLVNWSGTLGPGLVEYFWAINGETTGENWPSGFPVRSLPIHHRDARLIAELSEHFVPPANFFEHKVKGGFAHRTPQPNSDRVRLPYGGVVKEGRGGKARESAHCDCKSGVPLERGGSSPLAR